MTDISFPGLPTSRTPPSCMPVGELRENLAHFMDRGGVLGANLHPDKEVLVHLAGDHWQADAVTVAFVNGRTVLVLNALARDEPPYPAIYGAVGRTLALHEPEAAPESSATPRCAHCTALKGESVAWPCQTAQALGMSITATNAPATTGEQGADEPRNVPCAAAGRTVASTYAPGTRLTSADPEPVHGIRVRDDTGVFWERTDDHGRDGWANWERVDARLFDPEPWTKIAGNYGPVIVVRPQDRPG